MGLIEKLFGPKYRLVTDGTAWAIKRRDGSLFDLVSPGYWWKSDGWMGAPFVRDCWSDEQTARQWFTRLTS